MGSCSCTRRHFLLSICFLQVITIIERQVFDFLGYMWAPILVNFFHILFIIFGFYGAYHFRVKYIITYLIWNFLWIGWNAFLICFYLNVGQLDRDSDLLNLGTGSVSWFEANGYGCRPTYNMTVDDPFRPQRPESVEGCLLDYTLVELIQSGVQCGLALLGILGAILISCIFLDEDDRFDFMNGDAKSPQHTVVHPMYVSYTSIPTTSASATMQSNKHLQLQLQSQQQQQQNSLKLYHHQQQVPHFNQNYQLNNSNNNTLNNNLHQRQAPPQPPLDTTINHNASFQRHHQSVNHLTQRTSGDNSNSSSLRRQRHRQTSGSGPSPMSPQTTPSLSYASLQNSNSNPYLANSLSNSNYSIFQGIPECGGSSTHFARIHHKAKTPKSGLLSSPGVGVDSGVGLGVAVHDPVRPLERLSRNLEEEEDNFSMQQLSNGANGVTYVPFRSPTPSTLFVHENNNNSQPHIVFNAATRSSPNNNVSFPYEQNGLPSPLRVGPSPKARRPTQIPLPTVPLHTCHVLDEDEDEEVNGDQMLTPPPPPVPRPHIFHQRLGQAPYPDLSPEIAEKYAMPTQHVSVPSSIPVPVPHGSPMVRRTHRRHRPAIPAQANFCDQIRAPPPGYVVRTHSDDRLVEVDQQTEAAPRVNRRSNNKTRPRSFCSSIVGVQA
ncbi:sodium/potassium-transporting ATPase subunit beta-1-interacting protein [Drosophila madeirensis]|uniref:Sodium/potassium-transporting ATPase subunit beta-1-interacting protein n=1 Tax=Drosophila madeirensis TaxID=30013 RepID=A0AAU9G947_DROMD